MPLLTIQSSSAPEDGVEPVHIDSLALALRICPVPKRIGSVYVPTKTSVCLLMRLSLTRSVSPTEPQSQKPLTT